MLSRAGASPNASIIRRAHASTARSDASARARATIREHQRERGTVFARTAIGTRAIALDRPHAVAIAHGNAHGIRPRGGALHVRARGVALFGETHVRNAIPRKIAARTRERLRIEGAIEVGRIKKHRNRSELPARTVRPFEMREVSASAPPQRARGRRRAARARLRRRQSPAS